MIQNIALVAKTRKRSAYALILANYDRYSIRSWIYLFNKYYIEVFFQSCNVFFCVKNDWVQILLAKS